MKTVTFGMACPAITVKSYLECLSESHKYVYMLDVLWATIIAYVCYMLSMFSVVYIELINLLTFATCRYLVRMCTLSIIEWFSSAVEVGQ